MWVPDSLVLLGKHASEAAPINTTVKHTFSEFRRTHQDTWYEDVLSGSHTEYNDLYDYTPVEKSTRKKKQGKKGIFTPAHLDALEGLLTSSVNYYV